MGPAFHVLLFKIRIYYPLAQPEGPTTMGTHKAFSPLQDCAILFCVWWWSEDQLSRDFPCQYSKCNERQHGFADTDQNSLNLIGAPAPAVTGLHICGAIGLSLCSRSLNQKAGCVQIVSNFIFSLQNYYINGQNCPSSSRLHTFKWVSISLNAVNRDTASHFAKSLMIHKGKKHPEYSAEPCLRCQE